MNIRNLTAFQYCKFLMQLIMCRSSLAYKLILNPVTLRPGSMFKDCQYRGLYSYVRRDWGRKGNKICQKCLQNVNASQPLGSDKELFDSAKTYANKKKLEVPRTFDLDLYNLDMI